MKILFVVTARGGSKGVPRKNIAQIGGIPLIGYKILAARRCKFENRIIVSTDDEEIAAIAIKFGAEVPFMRPVYLAADDAGSMDVVDHAVNWVIDDDGGNYDYICLLEPSSPFLSYIDINKAFDLLIEKDADTLLGMKEVEVCREFINTLDEKGGLSFFYDSIRKLKSVRRQDQKPEYTMNGCIYAAKWEYYLHNHIFYAENSIPYIMPIEQSIEVDTQFDLFLAKSIVNERLVDVSMWK